MLLMFVGFLSCNSIFRIFKRRIELDYYLSFDTLDVIKLQVLSFEILLGKGIVCVQNKDICCPKEQNKLSKEMQIFVHNKICQML